MRVVIAPDKFAGTLSAAQAAAAIARGWSRRAPGDQLVQVPMADGGPGFCDVLHACLGGDLLAVTVTGPLGEPVPGAVLRVPASAQRPGVPDTAYVEAAHAVGLDLLPAERRDPEHATSVGVGELLLAALESGVGRVVVGLGGSGTNDGGAGMLAALGATASGDGALDGGPAALPGLHDVQLEAARERTAGVELVLASDVDNPLTGLFGATKVYGPQKGVAEERVAVVDGWLEGWAQLTDRRLSLEPGAGAAGGLGFGLLLLGGVRRPGIDLVREVVDLDGHLRGADLVLTGEGAFDFSSRSGKVPYGVAAAAAECLVPCVALAGQVLIGGREMRALGVEAAYSMVDLVGEEESLSRPAESLERLAERVARTWSH